MEELCRGVWCVCDSPCMERNKHCAGILFEKVDFKINFLKTLLHEILRVSNKISKFLLFKIKEFRVDFVNIVDFQIIWGDMEEFHHLIFYFADWFQTSSALFRQFIDIDEIWWKKFIELLLCRNPFFHTQKKLSVLFI